MKKFSTIRFGDDESTIGVYWPDDNGKHTPETLVDWLHKDFTNRHVKFCKTREEAVSFIESISPNTKPMSLHNEHLRKADESYEVRHDNNGNAIHVYIDQYGTAYVFPTLNEFVNYVYFREPESVHFQIKEDELELLYNYTEYNFYKLREAWLDTF
jgi:hypothetical protein